MLWFAASVSAAPKPLILSMGQDSFPFQFVDETGTPQGILVDLWREWGRVNQRQLIFVPKVWHESVNELATNKADVHIGMAANAERARQFTFLKPISEVSTYLYLCHELSGRRKFADLLPFQIGIVAGSNFEQELIKAEPGLSLKRYPTRAALLAAAARGELAVFAGMEGYLRDQKLQQQLAERFPLGNRLLVRKNPLQPAVILGNASLQRSIEQGFERVSKDKIREIERRWLGIGREQLALAIATPIVDKPFVEMGVDGLPQGLYVDIWQLWSQKTGIPVEFIPSSGQSSLKDVKTGLADVHIGHDESALLTSGLHRAWPIYKVKSRLFLAKNQPDDLKALAGKAIGVVPGSPFITQLQKALPDTELKFYPGLDKMLTAVQEGDIQAFVAPSATGKQFLLSHHAWGELRPSALLEFESDIHVLTRQGDEGLAARIVSGFNLLTPRELVRIEDKWILDHGDRVFDAAMDDFSLSDADRHFLAGVKPLKLGYLANWAPMEFTDERGQFSGVNADVAGMMSSLLGVKIEPVPFNEWTALLEALKRQEIDLVGSVGQAPEREGLMGYTQAYWPSPWALLSGGDGMTFYNLGQIEGQRLAVVEGYHIINRILAEHPDIDLVLVPDPQTGIDAVASGKADAFLDTVDSLAARLGDAAHPRFTYFLLTDFAIEQSQFAVSLSRLDLVPYLNKVLSQIDKSKASHLQHRWLMPAFAEKPGDSKAVLVFVLITALMLTAYSVIFIRNKRHFPKDSHAKAQAEERARHRLSHELLTQLPDRLLLDDRLNQSLLLHQRAQANFAVMFVHIEGLASVSHGEGEDEGEDEGEAFADDALRQLVLMFKGTVRRSDTIARFSEHEFVLLLNRITDKDKVCELADNLIARLSNPLEMGTKRLGLSISIGIAVFPTDGDSAIDLLQKAEAMMQAAKQAGGQQYRSA